MKKQPPRETRMRASGTVLELTSDSITIQRTITSETMVFNLEKPLYGINVGEKVTISYIKVGEKNIAKKVSRIREHVKFPQYPTKQSSNTMK
ncbi:MAG: hypothetical protein N2317_00275 [Syntrophales bacterium]|nr:hypothetical protein [Syntrophales bacterium]